MTDFTGCVQVNFSSGNGAAELRVSLASLNHSVVNTSSET